MNEIEVKLTDEEIENNVCDDEIEGTEIDDGPVIVSAVSLPVSVTGIVVTVRRSSLNNTQNYRIKIPYKAATNTNVVSSWWCRSMVWSPISSSKLAVSSLAQRARVSRLAAPALLPITLS